MRKVRTKLVAALCLYAGTAVICPLLAKASANNVNVQQQDNVCKGLVVDQKGEPIIGASVVIKGTANLVLAMLLMVVPLLSLILVI